MPREGELSYYEKIGDAGRAHSLNKPFSDPLRGPMLMEAGAVLTLLPPPPARVLECGCGAGWLTWMLAKCGYDTVGQDVSADAIRLAGDCPLFRECAPARFVLSDYESLEFRDEFDAVVFFAALHHATDERKAIQCAFRALKPGGVLVAAEPGVGHARKSRAVMEQYDVTDKDMPPGRIAALGRAAGFRRADWYPHGQTFGMVAYAPAPVLWRTAKAAGLTALSRWNGITVLRK